MKARIPLALLGLALVAAAAIFVCATPPGMPLHDFFLAAMPQAGSIFLAAAPLGAVLERKNAGGGGGGGSDDDGGPGFKKIKDLIESQNQAWETFKKSNDERLKELETKGHASADSIAKVSKVDAELTKLSAELAEVMKKMQRPGAGSGGEGKLTAEQIEHKQALQLYLREGKGDDSLHELEQKAMNSGSDPDGGYLVTAEMDTEIDRVASAETVMRRLANTRTIGKGSYKKLVKTRGVSGGWLGEQEDSSETQGPQWSQIEITAERQYAEPWIPNDMLEDADYDLEVDLTDEAGITFAELEADAFLNGNGIKKARGILTYPTIANANYAWGKLGFVKTGVSADFAASNPGDILITLQHSLRQRYRNGATFVMADGTLSKVRQMKDGSGNFYLWQPDPLGSFGGRLLGAPVEIDDYMPVLAADSLSIMFGNFKRGYTIVDRRGIAVIRDNVTKKGTTKFHFSRRVGGGVTNFEAIKLLKFGT